MHFFQRAMSRHSTVTSLPESLPDWLAKDLDSTSSWDAERTADCDIKGSWSGDEAFQERTRVQYQIDEDKVYMPELYADAFQVADPDLLLYDCESEDPLEAGDEIWEIDKLGAAITMLDASKFAATRDESVLVPKAPLQTAPRGFVRKHQEIFVVSSTATEMPGAFPSKPEFVKVPQGSPLKAVAALRPGNCTRGPLAGTQPTVLAAPCSKSASGIAGLPAVAPIGSTDA